MTPEAATPEPATVDTLVVTGGHPFEPEPFFAIFDALPGVSWSAATSPATGHDAVVFYDMPGIRFTRADPPLEMITPSDEQRAVFDGLCRDGTGLVFMHHAVAGWPAWEGYAELVGGRFHYQPGSLRGVDYRDSGYLFDVRHTVEVLEPEHPVCAGLAGGFTLTDELYCFPVLDDSITPLMRTTFDTSDSSRFFSADLAIRGERNSNDGWSHPPGSDLVAWTRQAGNSRIVYLQFGDGPETYADPSFRRVLQNAIHWTATRRIVNVGLCMPQLGDGLTVEIVREFAQRAERLGYTSLWVQDHFLWPLEPRRGYGGRDGAPIPQQYQSVLAPLELLTAAATWTTRVTLGTSILVAGNHWPVPLAQRLSTIDHLSQGRLIVGLGVGWSAEEHDASGTDITTRGARMDDFVAALLACWADDPIEHRGPFFTIPPSIMRPKPFQRPRPKLVSGMWSTAGLERTRVAFDGWNPAGLVVAKTAATLAQLNASRPDGMGPLSVHHRAFAQFPFAPTPEGDVVERLAAEAAEAAGHGFDDFIIEHNFWSGIAEPEAWLDVPEQFLPVVRASRESSSSRS